LSFSVLFALQVFAEQRNISQIQPHGAAWNPADVNNTSVDRNIINSATG
jgi:hypothetical protein